jgi:hypothetical protein
VPVIVSGEWPEDPAERADLGRDWHPDFGDRRQELVFIGVDLPTEQLHQELRQALLTDDELAIGENGWRLLPDPFPAWHLHDLAVPHQH